MSGNDLLAAWTDDPQVTAAALYLESFGNAPKFARLARRFSESKPLLAVVGGRSAGGQRAGASHTAAAATPAVGVAALFAQAGVIGCDAAEDLAEAALLLTREPLPRGDRVGLVSNAGGMGVLAADSVLSTDWSFPSFSDHARPAGRARLGHSGHLQPRGRRRRRRCRGPRGTRRRGDGLGRGGRRPRGAGRDQPDRRRRGHPGGGRRTRTAPPAAPAAGHPGAGRRPRRRPRCDQFRSSVAAVRALGRAATYAAWLAERLAEVEAEVANAQPGDLATLLQHRAEAASLLSAEADPDGWVGAESAKRLLTTTGCNPPAGSPAEPVRSPSWPSPWGSGRGQGRRPRVVHRTERGLVRVGLASADGVARRSRPSA